MSGVSSSGVVQYSGVVPYADISQVPPGFAGTAQVGTDFYSGDGVRLAAVVKNYGSNTRPLKIIPFGDSITASNSAKTLGLWAFSNGYAESSICQSGGRYTLLSNAGVSGNTTAQMLARVQTDVIALKPDVCLLLGGTNDFVSGMADSVYTSIFNNLENIIKALLVNKILPIIVTPPPKNAAATEAKRSQPFYYALARYYGLPLIDMYRTLVDPANGNYKAGLSSDNVHPNASGITLMIAQATPVLSNLANAFCPPYLASVSEASVNNPANLIRNGSFSISTTPPTPDSWTVNTTNAIQTLVAATLPYTGNTFNYVKSVAGGAYALSGSTLSSFAVGNTMQMNVEIEVSGLTPATASGFQVSLTSNAGGILRLTNLVQNGINLFSTDFVVPTGTTTLLPAVYVADAATYKVNNFTVINSTALGVIHTPGNI
jgi:lysophospholipase L1-like esterase